jgi:transcriptional regulator GlxA family with amidase domain
VKVAIFLYDAMTCLDAIGPYEVLNQLPDAEICFVAEKAGLVRNDTKSLALHADASIDEVEATDILLIPGGPGDAAVRQNERVLQWIRSLHETTTWTTSVCTGSLILAAAGLLEGRPATTHWMALDSLEQYGAIPTSGRFIQSDRIITAAGVSAGIDMGLELVRILRGDEMCQMIQLGIEYDPMPPFAAGSPDRAPEPIVAAVRSTFEGLMAARIESR